MSAYFYQEIIKIQGPNSFGELFVRITVERSYKVFKGRNKELEFMLYLYWHGTINRICKWIENDTNESIEWMTKCLFDTLSERIKKYYDE